MASRGMPASNSRRGAAAPEVPQGGLFLRRISWAIFGLAGCALAILGLSVRVIPSDFMLVFGFVAGVAVGTFAVRRIHPTIHNALEEHARLRSSKYSSRGSSSGAWASVILMPCIFALGAIVGFAAVAWGAPWVVNTSVGTVRSADFVVTEWVERTSPRRQGCSAVVVRPSLDLASPRTLCVGGAWQPGMRIQLVGPATVAGQNVEDIRLLP
jgi:hypothetical protein